VITNFGIVFGEWQALLTGFVNTVWICALAGALSLVLAVFVSMLLVSLRAAVRRRRWRSMWWWIRDRGRP
jgi:polar amino acid transport system permease protein